MSTLMSPEKYAATDTELAQQTALFLWAALPEMQQRYPEFKFMHAIPNGGSRHPAEAARLKASGVKKGVCDICLPCRRGPYSGLYMEIKKADGGVVSEDQTEFMRFVVTQGYCAVLAYGYEQAREALLKYMSL